MVGLRIVIDNLSLDEIEDTIGEHLRVQAEVFAVFEVGEDRIRNRADADLQRAAVFDQAGDVFTNALDDVAGGWCRRNLVQLSVTRDEVVDLRDVEKAVAK